MPRPSKGPRLYLRKRKGKRANVWLVRDNGKDTSTGCGECDLQGAEEFLAQYIAEKWAPPSRESKLARISCADVLNIYCREHAPTTRSLDHTLYLAGNVNDWWGDKTLADVRGQTCRDYVAWRCSQGVSDQTARRDLDMFRSAIKYYHKEYGPLDAVPAVTLPAKGPSRQRWLTRSEVARLLWAARRTPHVRRFILIALYTGTRSKAALRLRWVPSLDAGWFDLEAGVMYRRGSDETDTTKKRPPARIPDRLMPHLRRWRKMDEKIGLHLIDVCHYHGKSIEKMRRAWPAIRDRAGLGKDVVPHILRHTCVTWLLQAGVSTWEVSGFVGMSEDMVRETYGHHSPDFQSNAASARRKT
jgi:integrase